MSKYCVELYILGMLYFEEDTDETVVLDRATMSMIDSYFRNSLFLKKWRGHKDDNGDAAYFKLKLLKSRDPVAFEDCLGANLSKFASEIQFGYYHHRAIFKTKFVKSATLSVIRDYRGEIHKIIREKFFEEFTNYQISIPNKTSNLLLRYIYSYTLIVVPNGQKEMKREVIELDKNGYDSVFSSRSTAFGFALTESDNLELIRPKTHYVRISVPSIIIYLSGYKMDQNLLFKIIDGIYYGGIYQKIKKDHEIEKITNKFTPVNQWTHDLMIETYKVLKDTVSIQELNYISVNVDRISLLISAFAIIISLIALFK